MKKSKRRGRNAVTMHEVAEHAGVSPMTVSRVISGDANVKPETRKRVEAAIKHFGYSPNVAARNLARAATVHIGLLYNNPSAAYMNELLVGRAGAQPQGRLPDPAGEMRHARRTRRGGEAGGGRGRRHHPAAAAVGFAGAIEALRSRDIPFVAVATGRLEGSGLSVRIDDFEAAASMTRYLISLGHRRIGFIRGAPNQHASAERYAGYKAALREAQIPLRTEWVKQGSFTYRSGPAGQRATAHRRRSAPAPYSPAMTTWRPRPSRWPTG